MIKFRIHVIMLSDKVLANVLPALDYNFKPEMVVLCESDAMHKRGVGSRMAKFLKSKDIKVEFFRLGGADNFKELHKRFVELASKFSRPADVAVNLSGGSKLISMVAQSVFAAKNFTCMYAVPHQNDLIEMRGGKVQHLQLRDKIKLHDFFKIYGCTVISKREKNLKLVSGSHALCRELLSDLDKYSKHVSYLNTLAAGAESYFSLKAKANITEEQLPTFDLFLKHGFLSSFDNKMVKFSSPEDRSFCRDIWMEDYLHQTLKSINKDVGLQDFATSVEIESVSGIRTELDAAFLYKNQLYVIEAKISQMHDKGGDALYEPDSLKYLAGIDAVKIVVSLRGLKNFDKKRANEQGVHLVQSTEINELEIKIRAVIGVSSSKTG